MLTGRRTHRTTNPWAATMVAEPRFEVIPVPGIAAQVMEHLGPEATVTVTASPRQGLRPTVELATELARQGMNVVPHLSARLVRDCSELAGILTELTSARVGEVFVIGGDSSHPIGEFASTLDLLTAMAGIGHDFTVGVAGYPEPHPTIDDDVTIQAMWDKQAHAAYIVSQICFDARALLAWVRRVRRRGVQLPIRVGLPGPAGTQQLLRISTRVGVGDSARMLSKHRGLWRLAQPGQWRPDRLLAELTPAFDDPGYHLQGLHIYTFNALDSVSRWWRTIEDRHQFNGAR